MPEELTRFLRHLPMIFYVLLVAISALLFSKMLLLGYLLANGIYPYDLLDHELSLFGIYLLFAYFYAGLTAVLYGWAVALYSSRRGKAFPVPLSPLAAAGFISHFVILAVAIATAYDFDLYGKQSLIQLRDILLVASGGDKSTILLLVLGNLFVLMCLAILCGALYVGGFKGIMTGRVLPFVALFLVMGATPLGSSVVTSLVLRTWGIGGGLNVKVSLKDGQKLEGNLVLLTPQTVYLTSTDETKRVSQISRTEANRISVEQHTWTN